LAVCATVHTGVVTQENPAGWEVVDGALERTFEFPSFPEAIEFVNRVAAAAEEANHHPDIEIHYRQVKLRWWTHSAQAITDRDRELAERSVDDLPAGRVLLGHDASMHRRADGQTDLVALS